MELNRKHQLLVYADDVNMLGENLQTSRENTEIFIKASKDIGLEVDSEKTKYMITSCQQNIVQNQNIVTTHSSFENMEKFKYLGVTVTNTKRRIYMGNEYYYSLEKILSARRLSKKLKVETYKTVHYQLHCMVVKRGLSS